MPQAVYDRLVKQYQGTGTIEYFAHASDTTGNRQAGYAVYVLLEAGVYYGRTSYGSLGKNYRTNTAGAFTSLDTAKKEVTKIFNGKLKKNYRDDTYLVHQHKTPAQPSAQPVNVSNQFGFPDSIPVYSHYLPDNVEIEPTDAIMLDEKVSLEWYPNRMRFKIYNLGRTGIGCYDVSGQLEDAFHYPAGYENSKNEYIEMAYNGLLFLGYKDPSDNIVLLRYIAEAGNSRGTEVNNYAKQRNILLMILYTLTDRSGLSVTSPDSPIYANPRIVLNTDKEAALTDRKPLNRYANNLSVFPPDHNMAALDFIER